MPKPRVTATDQLANVIEVVELGRRTGLLSVERGTGSVHEEGEIYFLHGRATYASLAGLRGREALAAMSRWGVCRFSFDREVPSPVPNIATPPPGAPAPMRGSDPNLVHAQQGGGQRVPEGSGLWGFPQQAPGSAGGAFSGGSSGPLYPSGPLGNSGPLDGSGIFGTSGTFSNTGGLGVPRGGAGYGYGAPGGQGASSNAGNTQQHPFAPPTTTDRVQPSPTFLARRPRRAPDVRDLMQVVTSHNLSRSHRTILLLADGEHTVLDLARLSSKPVDEIAGLLSDLEARGLVYYYN
jgi:hypothetical protein